MYNDVHFEISGYCNAKCPWCVTGRGSINEKLKKFITANEFSEIMENLIAHKFICENSIINLYNWGEPFLNPELIDILKIICEKNCRYTLSTNASRYIKIPREVQKNLVRFVISMPGFSQKSYSKIHNFSFEKIIKNITKFLADIDPRILNVNYHIYQFNIDEIDSAFSFFSKFGVNIDLYYAYFNDFNLMQDYLNKNLSYDILYKASKELVLGYVDDLISQCPPEYSCPQWNMLAIDEWGSIITCCCIPKNHPYYSLNLSVQNMSENLSEDIIRKLVRSQPPCKMCIQSGQAYWANNVQRPDFVKEYYSKFYLKQMWGRYTHLIKRYL